SSAAACGTCTSSEVGPMLSLPPRLNQPEPVLLSTWMTSEPGVPVICSGLAPEPRLPSTCTRFSFQPVTRTSPLTLRMTTCASGVASWLEWMGVSACAADAMPNSAANAKAIRAEAVGWTGFMLESSACVAFQTLQARLLSFGVLQKLLQIIGVRRHRHRL